MEVSGFVTARGFLCTSFGSSSGAPEGFPKVSRRIPEELLNLTIINPEQIANNQRIRLNIPRGGAILTMSQGTGFFSAGLMAMSKAGRKIRFVSVAITRVSEVSHPRAWVPPNPLKQKITNPAISTSEV
jgi:hypothetical protein